MRCTYISVVTIGWVTPGNEGVIGVCGGDKTTEDEARGVGAGEETTGGDTTGRDATGGDTTGRETTGVEAGGETTGAEGVGTDIRLDETKVEKKGPEAETELERIVRGMVTGGVPVAGAVAVPTLERFPVGMLNGLLIKGIERGPDGRELGAEDRETVTEGIDGGLDGMLGGPQSKLTRWIPTSQSEWSESLGIWKVTEVAPPHCEFLTVVPDLEHGAVCLHTSPLSYP